MLVAQNNPVQAVKNSNILSVFYDTKNKNFIVQPANDKQPIQPCSFLFYASDEAEFQSYHKLLGAQMTLHNIKPTQMSEEFIESVLTLHENGLKSKTV